MFRAGERLKVLIPVDFSETARRALSWAFEYAALTPCDLHVLHVVENQLGDFAVSSGHERFSRESTAVAKEAHEELERALPAETRQRIGPPTFHLAQGHPAREILRIAEEQKIELVVIGSHGRSGFAGFLVGSVAEKVVRHATCPVVCVKPPRP